MRKEGCSGQRSGSACTVPRPPAVCGTVSPLVHPLPADGEVLAMRRSLLHRRLAVPDGLEIVPRSLTGGGHRAHATLGSSPRPGPTSILFHHVNRPLDTVERIEQSRDMSQNVSHSDMGRRYTHGHEQATLASHGARTAANSAAFLLPVLDQCMSLLDVGCGPGTITLDLAELVAPGAVVGIENVEEPLKAARAAAERRGDGRTRFQLGDATGLPFEDDSFDVVHAHQVLQHLTDPVRALKEMARVCKPGGWIAARDADYAAMTWYPEVRTRRVAPCLSSGRPSEWCRARRCAPDAGVGHRGRTG